MFIPSFLERLFLLKSDEGSRRNQILSRDELFFTEEMLECGDPSRDLWQDEIDLLGQILQLLT